MLTVTRNTAAVPKGSHAQTVTLLFSVVVKKKKNIQNPKPPNIYSCSSIPTVKTANYSEESHCKAKHKNTYQCKYIPESLELKIKKLVL